MESVARLADAKSEAKARLDPAPTTREFNKLTKPGSLSGTMKKAGIALIAAPDPITGVGGVALLATSLAMKKKEPTTLSNLAEETRRVLREMQSLSL